MIKKQKVEIELYVPKGGMCTACKKKHENCSKLEFEKMPIVNTFHDTAFVKCTEFEREAI